MALESVDVVNTLITVNVNQLTVYQADFEAR